MRWGPTLTCLVSLYNGKIWTQTGMHRKKTMQRHRETSFGESKNSGDLPELGRGIEQILPKPSKGINPRTP